VASHLRNEAMLTASKSSFKRLTLLKSCSIKYWRGRVGELPRDSRRLLTPERVMSAQGIRIQGMGSTAVWLALDNVEPEAAGMPRADSSQNPRQRPPKPSPAAYIKESTPITLAMPNLSTRPVPDDTDGSTSYVPAQTQVPSRQPYFSSSCKLPAL
jgi:hypothetical protein